MGSFILFIFPQGVTNGGSGLGASEDAADDDRGLHQYLITGGQGFLCSPWVGEFNEVPWVCRLDVEGGRMPWDQSMPRNGLLDTLAFGLRR